MGKHDGCFSCGCHQIYLKFDNMRLAHRWRICGRLSFRPWPLNLAHSKVPAHPSIKAAIPYLFIQSWLALIFCSRIFPLFLWNPEITKGNYIKNYSI